MKVASLGRTVSKKVHHDMVFPLEFERERGTNPNGDGGTYNTASHQDAPLGVTHVVRGRFASCRASGFGVHPRHLHPRGNALHEEGAPSA